MIVLPTTYMGSVEWYKRYLANPQEVQIEVMESFPKQTYRNRCTISQAIGRKGDEAIGKEPLTLSVPVKRADSKQLTRDVEISYQQRWQHQHWIALVSAYKRTPYFDYYAPYFESFYTQRFESLVEYNTALTKTLMRLLGIEGELHLSESYIDAQEGDCDLRVKNRESLFDSPRYFQLFSDRFPFEPNLSVVDLLFAEGPSAIEFLRRCRL